MRLSGKNALVTGSDQGIGQAIAVRLAEEGADVVIDCHSNRAGAEETRAQIEKMGRRAAAIQADVGVPEAARKLVNEAVAALGGLDILVNNAGIERNASFLDIPEKDYRSVIAVDLDGPFFATQAFARHRRDAKQPGKVINISSVHEELPFPPFHGVLHGEGRAEDDDAQSGD